MTNVLVTGVPHVKMSKILFVIKATFAKNRLPKTFWIQEFLDDRETNMKKMNIAFETSQEAAEARRFLDGFIYRLGSSQYVFAARTIEGRRHRSPAPIMRYRERSPVRHFERFDRRYSIDRSRSRSPVRHRGEASELDLEIELLRKRRLIIEEERRLLLERKKLDLVKEYGPTAATEFSYLDDHERKYEPRSYERRPYERERRRSIERFRRRSVERERPVRRARTPPRPKRGLPLFVLPCKLLIESMKDLIAQCSNKKASEILEKLIRATLRKRIAVALEGKGRMSTSSIITLYRKLYPETTDEALVKKLVENIKASYIPDLTSNKTESKGKEKNEEKKIKTEKKDNIEEMNIDHNEENKDDSKENKDDDNEENKNENEEKQVDSQAKEIDNEEKNENNKENEENNEELTNETVADGATEVVNDQSNSIKSITIEKSNVTVMKETEKMKDETGNIATNDCIKETNNEQTENGKQKDWGIEGGTDWNEVEVREKKEN